MAKRIGPVWVVAEQVEGQVKAISYELIGKAKELADSLGVHLEAVLLGNKVYENGNALIAAGADTVFVGDTPELEYYQPDLYTKIIENLAHERKPEIILIGSTYVGKELAGLLAAKLKTGLSAHCIDLELNETGELIQWIPAYGGLVSIVCPEKRPQMATVSKGVFSKPVLDGQRQGQIVSLEIPVIASGRVRTIGIERETDDTKTLENASIVVAGGAGARDKKGWQLIADLASVLGGALGATRPPVDEGWTTEGWMIGQSGKVINPSLYIGVGLSGELQHMVGISGAKVMVAINNDPKAQVFEQVDFGIVDDLNEFIPVLIQAIKVHKEKQYFASEH